VHGVVILVYKRSSEAVVVTFPIVLHFPTENVICYYVSNIQANIIKVSL
jgi:hypothetical protein